MSAYKEKTLSLEKEMVKEILEDGTYREDILFKKTLQREKEEGVVWLSRMRGKEQ